MPLPPILELHAEELKLMLAAQCHLGSQNVNAKMKKYIFTRRGDGIHIIHLGLTWEKLILAARIIVAVENPQDVCIVSFSKHDRRPALKFAEYVGTTCFIDRYIPGTLTNTTVKGYKEPLLLISLDPMTDHQVIKESQYCNMLVIALANAESNLKNVDVAIPCNNKSRFSTGVLTWLLARAVLRLRGSLSYDTPWDVPVDMFFHQEEEEEEKNEAFEQSTHTGKVWKEQPPWLTGSTSAFGLQSSFNDNMPWTDDPYNNNNDWMKPITGPIRDFKEAFGMTSSGPTDWADDVVEPGLTSNTDGWGSPAVNKNATTDDTGEWDSPAFQNHKKNEQLSATLQQAEETTGWGASSHEGGSLDDTGGW